MDIPPTTPMARERFPCHKDRTESFLACSEIRFSYGHAFLVLVDGEFGDEDGGLCKKTYEHDDTGLEVDVVVETQQTGEHEGAHKTEWNGQKYGKRNEPGFIQTSEYEIYQYHADQIYQYRGVALRNGFKFP